MSSRGAAASRDQYSDSFLDDLISRFRRDVDRAFSDLWGDTNRSSTTGIRFGVWTPRVDVRELENELVVHAELPGIPKDNVCVDVRGGNVVVSGENKPDDTYNTGTAWTRERRFGRFMRTIPLPIKVDIEKAKAKFENGLLEIRLPRTESTPAKRIAVQ